MMAANLSVYSKMTNTIIKAALFSAVATTITTFIFNQMMETSIIELLTYYVIGGALLIGAPAVFFLIAFMPALQNTKGRMVGYKDHKTYGDSSIYENTKGDNTQVSIPVYGNVKCDDFQGITFNV